MRKYIIQLKERMNKQLSAVSPNNDLQATSQKLNIMKEIVAELKAFILSHTFTDKDEEIEFFKKHEPAIYGDLIYYERLFEIESSLPVGKLKRKTFYKAEVIRCGSFLDRKRPWVIYFRTGSSYLDNYYFLRYTSLDDPATSSQMLTYDNRFCTAGSILFSRIIASEKLIKELDRRITVIDNNASEAEGEPKVTRHLKWKGPKVGLVELGYAFKEAGALDESLREIFACFEEFFSIKLDNTPRIFQEIVSRKKDEAVYLTKLVTMVKNRAERLQENYKPKK